MIVVPLANNEEEATTFRDTGAMEQKSVPKDSKKEKLVPFQGSEDIPREHDPKEEKKTKRKHKKLIKPGDFDEYSFVLPHIELESDAVVGRKFRYVINEALSDLGFHDLCSIDLWITILILIMILWVRAYLHTFGSWAFLKIAGTPINVFDPMM